MDTKYQIRNNNKKECVYSQDTSKTKKKDFLKIPVLILK